MCTRPDRERSSDDTFVVAGLPAAGVSATQSDQAPAVSATGTRIPASRRRVFDGRRRAPLPVVGRARKPRSR
jgi:hypothetical protein